MSDPVSDALDSVTDTTPTPDPVSAALDTAGTSQPSQDSMLPAWEQSGYGRAIALAGRAIAQGVAALPMMAMDAGVASRNILGDVAHKALGRPATPDYELPSQMWDRALNAFLPQPKTGSEKGASLAESTMVGGAFSPSGLEGAFQTETERAAATAKEQAMRPIRNGITALQDEGLPGRGYVVPPATAAPTEANRAVESIAGKIATQQRASLMNQPVTNALAKKALGVDQGVPLTAELPAQIRAEAAQGYEAVRSAGQIKLGDDFKEAVSKIMGKFNSTASEFPSLAPKDLQPIADELSSKDSASADAIMGAIRGLRDKASTAFRQGEGGLGSAYKQLSGALEGAIDKDLSGRGEEFSDVLQNFRDARQKMAIAHTVEDAMNPATGNVNAGKLAAALRRGEPLSGPLKTIAEFANAAPRAVQEPTSSMGVSHLNATWPAIGALGGELMHGFEGGVGGAMLGVGIPIARTATQKAILSGARQGALLNQGPTLAELLGSRVPGAVAGARQDWNDVIQ